MDGNQKISNRRRQTGARPPDGARSPGGDRRSGESFSPGSPDGTAHRTAPPLVAGPTGLQPADAVDALSSVLRDLLLPPPWVAGALCAQVDPELFFPDKGGNVRDARRICARCEVLDECGEYALERPELDGVWGGLTTRQRRTVRRARKSQGEAPLTAARARGEEAAA